MKIKTRLIASAPSEEEIKNMIAQYFCSKPENYRISGTGLLWSKMPDGTERWLKSFRVIQKKGRFRFEAVI
jgi:hypothetical protein